MDSQRERRLFAERGVNGPDFVAERTACVKSDLRPTQAPLQLQRNDCEDGFPA
jgi:hypothetical protein